MPTGWLAVFAEMYPRLRDEDMLREIAAVSAGVGTMPERAREDLMRELQHAPRVPVAKPTVADLAAIGIRVVTSV